MPRPKTFTLTPQSDADGICQSQTPNAGGAQSLTINGALATAGVVTLNYGHLVEITSVGDDSGRTFTITGTYQGDAVSDTITGANAGIAAGTKYIDVITDVDVDDDTAGAVTVGVNGKATTPWWPTDWRSDADVTALTEVSGDIDYTLQYTNEKLSGQYPNDLTAVASFSGNSTEATATAVRAIGNSGTGTLTVHFSQG